MHTDRAEFVVEAAPRGLPEPGLPIDARRQRLLGQVAWLRHRSHAGKHALHRAQATVAHGLGRGREHVVELGALLRANLEGHARRTRSRRDRAPFGQRERERLLAVHVLAGQACRDRRLRVPMVGRGHDDRIDRWVRDQFAPRTRRRAHRALALRVHAADALVAPGIDHVGDADHLDPGMVHEGVEQLAPALAVPHDPHVDATHRATCRRHRCRRCRLRRCLLCRSARGQPRPDGGEQACSPNEVTTAGRRDRHPGSLPLLR